MRIAPLASLVAGSLVSLACTRDAPPSPSAPAPSAAPSADLGSRPSLGNVMVEVARRFEIAGRAATAGRYELAAFEAGEIEEVFEGEVPRAELPKEGPTAHIPAMAKAFLTTNAPALEKAAEAKDAHAFEAAFQQAAAACNACHAASAKAFIQVPNVPGKSVPDLDPLPTAH